VNLKNQQKSTLLQTVIYWNTFLMNRIQTSWWKIRVWNHIKRGYKNCTEKTLRVTMDKTMNNLKWKKFHLIWQSNFRSWVTSWVLKAIASSLHRLSKTILIKLTCSKTLSFSPIYTLCKKDKRDQNL